MAVTIRLSVWSERTDVYVGISRDGAYKVASEICLRSKLREI